MGKGQRGHPDNSQGLLYIGVWAYVGSTPVFWIIKLSQQTEAERHQMRERISDWLTV